MRGIIAAGAYIPYNRLQRAKIGAAVTNARAVCSLRQLEGEGACSRLIWSYQPAPHPAYVAS